MIDFLMKLVVVETIQPCYKNSYGMIRLSHRKKKRRRVRTNDSDDDDSKKTDDSDIEEIPQVS